MGYFLEKNKSLNQDVFVTLLQLQNPTIIYPFCFFSRPKNDSFLLPFTVLLLEKSLSGADY